MKIVYIVNTDPYDDSSLDIKTSEVSSLDDDKLNELLKMVVNVFKSRNNTDQLVQSLKNEISIFTQDDISLIDQYKVKGNALYTYFDYGLQSLSATDKIPDYELKRIHTTFKNIDPDIFLQIEVPDGIRKQYDAYKNNLNRKLKEKIALKKKREIEKAKLFLCKNENQENSV